MSMEALLHAVKARLQDVLGVDDSKCDIMPDSQPPPFDGERFYAVHPGSISQSSDQAHRIEEYYSARVTITFRSAYAPTDRHGTEVIAKRVAGVYADVGRVRAALHGSYTVLNDANGLIDADQESAQNGFIEPLLFSGAGEPMPQYGHWFHAGGNRDLRSSHEGQAVGYSVELTFRDARRDQQTQGAEVAT